MVKKLLKQELSYYLRHLSAVFIVLLGVALMGRFVRFFESEGAGYALLNGSATAALFIGSYAALILTTIFCIIRFFKNLFGSEGYLTLTLPASEGQHLFAKLIGAMAANLATFLVIIAAFNLFYAGEWTVEVWKSLLYLTDFIAELAGVDFGVYVIEILILLPISAAAGYLTYYVCICMGQTLRRGRIIAAIGIYYGLNLLLQILMTVLILVCSTYRVELGLIPALEWIETNPIAFIHVFLFISIVINALWGGLCFGLSRRIMRRKLNLE